MSKSGRRGAYRVRVNDENKGTWALGFRNQRHHGWIYFIRCDLAAAIKVGWTKYPLARFATLQTATPVTLEMVTAKPGTLREEKALHREFMPFRMRGEWYRAEGPVLDLMNETLKALGPTPWAPPTPPDPFAFHRLKHLMVFSDDKPKWTKPGIWRPD